MVNVGRKTSPVEHRDVSDSSSTESEDLDSSWDAEDDGENVRHVFTSRNTYFRKWLHYYSNS